MKVAELKAFMKSEEWKQEGESVKIISIIKLILLGLLVPFMWFMVTADVIIFILSPLLKLGFDFEIVFECSLYLLMIYGVKKFDKKKLDLNKRRKNSIKRLN